MKRILFTLVVLSIQVITAQVRLDQITLKHGDIGGEGRQWRIAGSGRSNAVLLRVEAEAEPLTSVREAESLIRKEDWFPYFILEVRQNGPQGVVYSRKVEFPLIGGLVQVIDTLRLDGQGGEYQTLFRFDTEKIKRSRDPHVLRFVEGTIETASLQADGPPQQRKPDAKSRFKVD